VAADGAQMQHVVMNLVRNSAEAIGSRRGVISLRTGARTYDESELADGSIGAIPEPGAFVFLEIRDDGPGMAPEILSRTFEPFTSPKSSGRGLGLAGALGVVHGHDGTIQVASEPSRGTRVRILLPASRREAPAPAAPESAAPILAPDQGSILVVDDDRLVRDLVTLMLERAGMSVLTAVDGVEALAAFEAHHTEIACVILDLTMPRMGGEETLERIRAMDATMPVLLSSGYGRPESATRLEDEAFTDFLAKPYDAADLLARIRAIMNPASDEKRAPPE